MSSDRRWQCNIVPLQIDGVDLQVAAFVKPGTGTPLVFLHGFGSTKEDYADVAWHPDLGNRPVLAYDAPGLRRHDLLEPRGHLRAVSGQGRRGDDHPRRLHPVPLIGHSMGGLTGLLWVSDTSVSDVG